MRSLSAYGEVGPDKVRESFVLVAYWVRGDLVRDSDAFPAPALPDIGDHPSSGHTLCLDRHSAAQAGTYRRGRDGPHLIVS